jgi:two-component system CheB/CheR fusion protein
MADEANTHYENLQAGHRPAPVVAIGASAGGQEAIIELLKVLPADTGLAYVYIQHLSPDYESHLETILTAVSPIPVRQAEHLMPVQPDRLYVIPPNKDMEIIDGVLVLMPRKPRPNAHMPIDQFFTSLASRQKDGAIGIILSGMASDGTLGLRAIKVAGGITFAQDETALYQSMPKSAIAEGVVDMVLSPAAMAEEIARLSKQADIFQLTNETAESALEDTSDKDLEKILFFVKSAIGVDFGHYKKTTIRRRIIRRMLLYKLETLKEYHQFLRENPAEAETLYNDLLINVTNFFRDDQTMVYLKKEILPKILKNKTSDEGVRIWIPACSTGQEAYSLAMILMEILGERAGSIPIQIFATDLSETAIAKARVGIYTKSEVVDIAPKRLDRFFTVIDDHFRINKLVRDLCVFAPHNLLNDPPFSRLDLISCRNLMIYLDEALQKKALATFHYALNPDGFLLLGKSEAVGSSPAHFSQVEKNFKVFTRKNNTQARIPLEMSTKKNAKGQDLKISVVKNTEMLPVDDLDKLVDNLLLSKYVPASVVVDQDLEIIQFRGSTSLFLEPSPGKASLNLTKMARPSLVFELRNIVHKAKKTALPASKEGLEVKVNHKVHYVSIEAVPITNQINQQLYLILFEETKQNIVAESKTSGARDKRILQLEAELSALRQDMHSIIEEQEASNEELQSANEEIVSSNEELQSINEELETSKEEIESANEELQTINQELQIRNDQLTEAQDYSEAILSTINEATLVLDKQLRIKSANKAFYKNFRFDQERTEGSMLYELDNRQLDFPGFRQLLEDVLGRNLVVKGFEVSINISSTENRTVLIHARKVVQHQNQTILLVFEDITEHRKAQGLLQERQQWFEELVDNSPTLIWVAQTEGKINFFNKAWLEFTGLRPDPEYKNNFSDAIHPAEKNAYLNIASTGFERRAPFSFEYRLRQSNGQYRWMLENTKPTFSPEGNLTGFIGTCTDIHLQKTLTEQLNHHVEQRTQQLKEANSELASANLELVQTADRLQSVLNGVPASVTLMEPVRADDGHVIDFITSVFNQKTLELTGQTQDQVIRNTLLESHPQIKESGLFDLYVQVLDTGQTAYQEISGLRNLPEETLAFLITRQVDRKGIVVTTLDISNRKQAENKLIQTAESLQAVLDSSPGAIAFFKALNQNSTQTTDFKLVVCNQRFSRKFKRTVRELNGQAASELYDNQQLAKMQQVLSDSKVFYEEQYNPDNNCWMAVSISRHDHGVAITELDITALKTAENDQESLIRQLDDSRELMHSLVTMKQYVQQRGEFLRSTSHDLRGSFGIIVGATSLLKIMDTEEDRAKTLDMIQRNLRQVSQMMNQLLDYSRLESGLEVLEISQFDAAEMLAELCEGSTAMAAERGLWLRFEGTHHLPVAGDAVKLRRIVQNLILNAVKYTQKGGIFIKWEDLSTNGQADIPDSWQFSITDTGPGISGQLLYKLADTDSGEQQTVMDDITDAEEPDSEPVSHGEGIGLFIVKRLCELLKGKMYVASSTESGTVFRIALPKSY